MLRKLVLLLLCLFTALLSSARAQTTKPDNGRTSIRVRGDQNPRTLSPAEKNALLEVREAVWRAYFTNDQAQLEKLIPADTIALEGPLDKPFVKKAEILESARQGAQRRPTLPPLDFPHSDLH